MAEKTLDYFQKREKKNQDFLAGNPEMETVEKLEGYQKKSLLKQSGRSRNTNAAMI